MGKKFAGILFAMVIALTTSGLTFTEPESADAAGNLPSAVLSKEVSLSEAADVSRAELSEVSASQPSSGSPESETVKFAAELQFNSAMDDHVVLRLTNLESEKICVAEQAHYMDQLGSAGSWDCMARQETAVEPGETVDMEFNMDQAVTHGENSILAFYIQYQGQWYLAKVGEQNGTECFLGHD
ncbi:MAG: hypothetical protein HFE75_00735 [Firmicutes bacterium]|jgi:hypothetical protein|nr:hypothetical protein [Bacillota bacterium]